MKYCLLKLLVSPVDPLTQRSELNYLIEECFNIATIQVKFQLSKLHKHGIMGDLTAKDIAIDAIAPLFTPSDDGYIHHLAEVSTTWSPAVTTEEQARFMLVSVLAHRVKQHIHVLMRENDPFFAKILDSLNYHIKKERLVKSEQLKICYISKLDPAKFEVEYYCYEDLLKLHSDIFSIKHLSISEVLCRMSGEDDKPAAIPFLALAKRIKEVNLTFENPVIVCQATETEFDVHRLSSEAKQRVLERLKHSYLEKGKLTEKEALLLENALNDLLTDLKDGGIRPGLFHYIEYLDNSISPEVYKAKYQNILEYLLKVLKKELAHLLLVKSQFSE
ncbi:hypothetical protein MASR1M107_09270 [Ignavibacteriales bacterium]